MSTNNQMEGIIRRFITHVLSDEKHAKRIDGDPIKELSGPLLMIARAPKMPEHAGEQFVVEIGRERKIVGNIDPDGTLVPLTLYGRGNPVDRRRQSVDLTRKVGIGSTCQH